jgi:pimeloyl-ACP methyl ester carboxylesterase
MLTTTRATLWLIPILAITSQGSCSDNNTAKADANISAAGLRWESCSETPLNTPDGSLPSIYHGVSCTRLELPLRYAEPNGKSITQHTWRSLTTKSRRGSLIMLDGGPGQTGAYFLPALSSLSNGAFSYWSDAGWDLIVPEHRGTGLSSPQSCPNPKDHRGCHAALAATLGQGLDSFGPAEAAQDVCAVAAKLRADGESTIALYGISYGTLWAHHVLAACPQYFNNVVLEGVMAPMTPNFMGTKSAIEDDLARRVLKACELDATCKTALAGSPIATAELAHAKAVANTLCSTLHFDLKSWQLLMLSALDSELGAPLLPATIVRALRCNATDIEQLQFAAAQIKDVGADDSPPELFNSANSLNALCLIRHGYNTSTRADIKSLEQSALVSANESEQDDFCAPFPPYHAATTATTTPPILLLQGEFDLGTPLAWSKLAATAYSQAKLVVIPTGQHVVDLMSEPSCAHSIATKFASGVMDSSCITGLPVIDFAGATAKIRYQSEKFFGTSNLFGEP